MALHMIIGNAGDGKTYALYQEIINRPAHTKGQDILIVPEQATQNAQKELTAMHPNHCILTCDILSFRRLAYRLTEELGDCLPAVLEDTGKAMLLKRILRKHGDELTLYAGKERKKGFVGELRSMISEFSQYCVEPAQLLEVREQITDPMLQHKLRDLEHVYQLFEEAAKGNYLTEADLLSSMCELLGKSEKMRGCRLFLDGFTGFTPAQYRLIRQLFFVASEIFVTISMDPGECRPGKKPDGLFAMSRETKAKLERLSEECGQTIAEPVFVNFENSAPALKHLKRQIFRYPFLRSEENPPITVRSLANREEEIRYVIENIDWYVRREGYRYRDMGILCGDVKGYSEDLQKAFRRAEIPFFIDYKENVMENPCVDLIRSALRVITTDFRRDAVVHFMKNRLSGFSFSEAAWVENYLLATGLFGKSVWSRDFVRTYPGQVTDLPTLNRYRIRLMETMAMLMSGFKRQSTVREGLVALYEFLVKTDASGQMEQLADEMAASPEIPDSPRREKEYRQIYKALLQLMEHMDELLGDQVIPISEFAEILDTGFEETMIGIIPPKSDAISVGDVKRSRLQNVKVLFFIGVNEGLVPGFSHGDGLLTDREREVLAASGMELSKTAKESVATEEFYLYLAMAKPSEKLYLTFCRCREDGKEMRPSYVIHRIMRIFPKLTMTYGEEEGLQKQMAPDGGEKLLMEEVKRQRKGLTTPEGAAIRRYFERKAEPLFGSRMTMEELKKAAVGTVSHAPLSPALAQALYSQTLRGSVSRMECFAKCAYRHFLQYGLRLAERKEFQVSNLDVGNLLHSALYEFAEGLRREHLSFRTISMEDANPRIHRAVEKALESQTTDLFQSSNRNRYQLNKLETMLRRTIGATQEQLRNGSFEPWLFEHKFTHYDERLELTGTIDRIDICESDGVTYFKVVDYKSSDKSMEWDKLYDGISVQLPAYLMEARKFIEGDNVPSAALYSTIKNPMIDKTKGETGRLLRKEMCPEGYFLEDEKVIRLLDNNSFGEDGKLAVQYESDAIPLSTTKSKTLTSTSKYLQEKDQETVFLYIEWLFAMQTKRIMQGEIEAHPYRKGTASAKSECEFCSFGSVCGFEPRLPGCTYREGTALSKEEVFARMNETMKSSKEETTGESGENPGRRKE